jgi:hypothetical protein
MILLDPIWMISLRSVKIHEASMKKVQVPMKKMAEDPLFVDPVRLLFFFPFYLTLPEAPSIFLEVKRPA